MNVKRLDGRLLNYWVAKSADLQLSAEAADPKKRHDPDSGFWHPHSFNPANDWSHAGPIVAADWFEIDDMLVEWFSPQWPHIPAISENPLKWFMRAYVATKFGDEVEEVESPTPLPPLSNEYAIPASTPIKTKLMIKNCFKPFNW